MDTGITILVFLNRMSSGSTPSGPSTGPSTIEGSGVSSGSAVADLSVLSFPVTPALRTPANISKRMTELKTPLIDTISDLAKQKASISAERIKKESELSKIIGKVGSMSPVTLANVLKLEAKENATRAATRDAERIAATTATRIAGRDATLAASASISAAASSAAASSAAPSIVTSDEFYITITDALFVFLGKCIPVPAESSAEGSGSAAASAASAASASAGASFAPTHLWMFNEIWERLKNYLQANGNYYQISIGKLIGLVSLDTRDLIFLRTICPILDPEHPYNITRRRAIVRTEKDIWEHTLQNFIGSACVSRLVDGTPFRLLSLDETFHTMPLAFNFKAPDNIRIDFMRTPWHISIMHGTVLTGRKIFLKAKPPFPFTIHLTKHERGRDPVHLYLVVPPTIRSMSPPCLELNSRDCYSCSRSLLEVTKPIEKTTADRLTWYERYGPSPPDPRLSWGTPPAGTVVSGTSVPIRTTWNVNGPHLSLLPLATVRTNVRDILTKEDTRRKKMDETMEQMKRERLTALVLEASEKQKAEKAGLESHKSELLKLIVANKQSIRNIETKEKALEKNVGKVTPQLNAMDVMFRSFLEFVGSKTPEAKDKFSGNWGTCFSELKSFLETNPSEEQKKIVLSFIHDILYQFPELLKSLKKVSGAESEVEGLEGLVEEEDIGIDDILVTIRDLVSRNDLRKGHGHISSLFSRLGNLKSKHIDTIPVSTKGGYTRRSRKHFRTTRRSTVKY